MRGLGLLKIREGTVRRGLLVPLPGPSAQLATHKVRVCEIRIRNREQSFRAIPPSPLIRSAKRTRIANDDRDDDDDQRRQPCGASSGVNRGHLPPSTSADCIYDDHASDVGGDFFREIFNFCDQLPEIPRWDHPPLHYTHRGECRVAIG